MSEIDDLVQRAVRGVTALASTASRFAGRVLLVVALVSVTGFLLGVQALSGGIQSVWIVLGIVFGSIAIGSAFLAWWRVFAVKRHVPELADEIRTLVTEGKETGRTVVDTFVVDDDAPTDAASDTGSAIVMSRRMYGFRSTAGAGLESSMRVTAAMTALTSFPLLLLMSVLIALVFAFLAFIFLIALAL